MKKLIALLLALLMLLPALPAIALAADEHTITSDTYPLYFGEIDTGLAFPLYFLDGATDLPYMEVNDFPNLMEGSLNLSVSIEDPVVTFTRDNGPTMVIDFEKDTFEFRDYNLFLIDEANSTLLDFTSMTFFSEEGEPALMQKSSEYSFDRYGDIKVIRFGDYGIDLVSQDGLYLIPLQTLNDFVIATKSSQNLFFNGQCMMLTPNMSPGSEVYYAAPTGERSEALAEYGYNELCIMLDSLYGLKEAHDITSFGQMFYEVGFDEILRAPGAGNADLAIYYLINHYLDDLHSSFKAWSYLTGPIDHTVKFGPSETRLIEHARTYMTARHDVYPDGPVTYEEVGNTAYITFDLFTNATLDGNAYYGYESPADIPFDDTIAMVIRAHEQITRENSPIENVVIDLSCNTGGAVDTAAYLLAWLLGEASISIKDTFTGAMANTSYKADVNLDREFDESDTLAGKKLFCLISPVSFSCGNLVPCALKESGRVTLLGRTSGGGTCTVQHISSAWGTSFDISSSHRMSFLMNGSFYDIDRGAEPDFVITDPAKYYDRAALTDYINSLF